MSGGAATITLTEIEQAAALRHLELQRCRLDGDREDQWRMERLLCRVASGRMVDLTLEDAIAMLRYLRAQYGEVHGDLLAIEERRLGGLTSDLSDAWRALDADAMLLNGIIRKLWSSVCAAQ